MEKEFEYQVKFINYCGILESPSKKWRSFFKILQIFNVLVNIYCLITLLTFMAENYSNILEISECMAPVITTIMALMKFSLLFFYTDDIFDLIREIRMLNRECKKLFTNDVHETPLQESHRAPVNKTVKSLLRTIRKLATTDFYSRFLLLDSYDFISPLVLDIFCE